MMFRTLAATCFLATIGSLVVVPGRLIAEYERTATNASCESGPTSIVLHLRRHGMCNRLRTMAALSMIAEDIGFAALHVSWEAEPSCNARFADLFVSGHRVIPIEPSTAQQQRAAAGAETSALLQPFASGRMQERSSRLLSAAAAERFLRSANGHSSLGSIGPDSLAMHAEAAGRSVRSDIALLSSSGTTHVLVHSSFAFMRVLHLHRLIRGPQVSVHGMRPSDVEPARSPHDAATSIDEYVAAFSGGNAPDAASSQSLSSAVSIGDDGTATAALSDAAGVPASDTSCPHGSSSGSGRPGRLMVHVTSDTPNVPPYLPCATFFARKGRFYRSLVPVPAVTAAVCLVWQQLTPQAVIAPGCAELLSVLGFPEMGAARGQDAAAAGDNAKQHHDERSWPPHPLQHRLLRTPAAPVVGLHVRVHDPAHDYAVVPGPGGTAEFGSQYASSLAAFASHAARLQVAQPDARVLLATNDCSGHVRATIAAGLRPGSVLTAAGALTAALAALPSDDEPAPPPPPPPAPSAAETDGLDGASLARLRASLRHDLAEIAAAFCAGARDGGSARGRGAADARASLVDFLLLSQADLILGSYWSSFTEEAAAVHGTHLLTLARGSVLTMVPAIDGGGWGAEDYSKQWEEVREQLGINQHGQSQSASVADDGAVASASASNATSLPFRSRRPPLGRHSLPSPLQSSATCGYPAFINRRSMEKLKFAGELLSARRWQRQWQRQETVLQRAAAAGVSGAEGAAGAFGQAIDASADSDSGSDASAVESGLLDVLDPELDALIESALPSAASRTSIPAGAAAVAAAAPGGAHETDWLSVPVGVAAALRGRFRSHPRRALLSGQEIDQASTIVFETRECRTPTALAIRQRWGLDEQHLLHGDGSVAAEVLPHVPIYCVTE